MGSRIEKKSRRGKTSTLAMNWSLVFVINSLAQGFLALSAWPLPAHVFAGSMDGEGRGEATAFPCTGTVASSARK